MMKLTGKQLVFIIVEAGLESLSRRELVDALADQGYDVSPGSAGRALSQARGTWSGSSTLSVENGVLFERGAPLEGVPQPDKNYLSGGELMGGGDIIQLWEDNVDMPLSLAYPVLQGGAQFNQGNRFAIEAALQWIYRERGIGGGDALELLEEAVNRLQDETENTSLYEVSVLGGGGRSIEDAIISSYFI